MFVDTVKVQARAGKGGNGCIAFSHEPFKPKGGPCGGDGGKGGDVILQADHDINNLIAQYYSPHLHAKDGRPGEGKGKKTSGKLSWHIVKDNYSQGDSFGKIEVWMTG